MFFKQFYLGCLAHASYLVGSEGEAAVVDPQRDVDQYIEEAERQNLEIRWVIETHLHADFVSGHRELAARTGAKIVFGARANAEFEHVGIHDGEEIRVGRLVLRAIETPGHTPESVTWAIIDGDDPEAAVKLLTGDTLFIGDVGRPDLVGSKGFTTEMMASMMYDSLHHKILQFPDATEIWPAHGAGSACGKNLSTERTSTLGLQRKLNWALQSMPKDEFVRMLTTDLGAPPRYFPMDAEINRRGARPVAEIPASRFGASDVQQKLLQGLIALDVRDATMYGCGHLPGSINIGLGGEYASWAGQLLGPGDRVVIVADGDDEASEAIVRLARVGLENAEGWLDGGIVAWSDAGHDVAITKQWTVDDLNGGLDSVRVIDVRSRGESASGHIPGSTNIPLDELPRRIGELDLAHPTAVICAGGYRSSIGASLLERAGARDVVNVAGGTSAWIRAGFETA